MHSASYFYNANFFYFYIICNYLKAPFYISRKIQLTLWTIRQILEKDNLVIDVDLSYFALAYLLFVFISIDVILGATSLNFVVFVIFSWCG